MSYQEPKNWREMRNKDALALLERIGNLKDAVLYGGREDLRAEWQAANEEYRALKAEADRFQERIDAVLGNFQSEQFKPLLAVLDAIPGNYDYAIENWIKQLEGLGLLKADQLPEGY